MQTVTDRPNLISLSVFRGGVPGTTKRVGESLCAPLVEECCCCCVCCSFCAAYSALAQLEFGSAELVVAAEVGHRNTWRVLRAPNPSKTNINNELRGLAIGSSFNWPGPRCALH